MAIYTQISSSQVRAFLAAYDLGNLLSFVGIATGVENSNYDLRTTFGRFILTIYEKRVRHEDLPFFLGLMTHLASRDFFCPLPLAGRDGLYVRTLCGQPAALVSFLPGHSLVRPRAADCRAVGMVLAELHARASDFDLFRANSLSLSGWDELLRATAGDADRLHQGLRAILRSELDYLRTHWPTDLPRGVIHGDLFPDNVFFCDGVLSGVIDFYFACNDFLAYDLAVTLNAWCFPDDDFSLACSRALLEGYQMVRPLRPEEWRVFPLLCRASSFRFLLTRLYDWLHTPKDAQVVVKDPLVYWRRLSFHRAVTEYRAYGLSA